MLGLLIWVTVAAGCGSLVLVLLGLRDELVWTAAAWGLLGVELAVSRLFVIFAMPLCSYILAEVAKAKGRRHGSDWNPPGWFSFLLGPVLGVLQIAFLVVALPWLAFVSCRLAKADSWWAGRFYDEAKLERARARHGPADGALTS